MNVSRFFAKNNHCLNISSVLVPQRVCVLDCREKETALRKLIKVLATAPPVKDPDELEGGIFYREQLMSTGIGMGIAVPHVRLGSVEKPTMAAGVAPKGIKDYESLDNAPVNLIFMIAAGKDQHKQYLCLLSAISSRLKDESIRKELLETTDGKSFCDILIGREND